MARLAAGCRKKENGSIEKRFVINGKRYSVSGKTSKECLQREMEIREMVAKQAYRSNCEITLQEYFEEFEQNRKGVVKKSTETEFRRRFKNHIEPTLGQFKIADIEKRQIQKLQKDLAENENLKATTVNLMIITLSTILNAAVDDEIISRNPAAGVKPLRTDEQPKASETIHRALTPEEQSYFLEAIKDEWMYPFAYFSLTTGMRLMEIGALTWGDIDYKENVIHVTKTLFKDQDKGEYVVSTPKSKTSVRDIPMNDIIRKILAKQKEKVIMVHGWKSAQKDSRIFVGLSGGVIQSRPFTAMVERAVKRIESVHGLKVEPFTHHAMRDTFATRYIEAGGDMQTLKTILGHASFAMTADLYAHVLPNTKQKEMDLVSSAFGSVAAI